MICAASVYSRVSPDESVTATMTGLMRVASNLNTSSMGIGPSVLMIKPLLDPSVSYVL